MEKNGKIEKNWKKVEEKGEIGINFLKLTWRGQPQPRGEGGAVSFSLSFCFSFSLFSIFERMEKGEGVVVYLFQVGLYLRETNSTNPRVAKEFSSKLGGKLKDIGKKWKK